MKNYQFQVVKNNDTKDKVAREKSIEELDKLKQKDEPITFNLKAEELFVDILCELIEEFGNRLYKKQAINEMSYRIHISPVTAKRYLEKHTTRQAKFEIENNLVRCKKCDQNKRFQIKVTEVKN